MTMAVEQEFSDAAMPQQRGGLSRWLGRNVWAMCDQILISAANFITMALAARAMGKTQFGAFTLVYSALLLANVLQSTLVTQAHNVIAATKSGLSYATYTSSTAVGQIAIVLIEMLAAVAVAFWAWKTDSAYLALLIALIPGIVGWQLQEFVRRVLYTEGRIGAAFANDVISYAGQTLWIIALWYVQKLTGSRAMYALAWTSLAAAIFGVWQLRDSICLRFDWSVLAENWHFGKWLAGAELVGWCSSLNMYLWLAAKFVNTGAAGDLKAAQLVFGPTRVLAFFLGNILPIQFARSLARGGDAEMHGSYYKTIAVIAPLLGGYCILAAVFAKPLMGFYGPDYAGDVRVLQLYALCAFLSYMQMVVAAALSAKRLTWLIFTASVWGGAIPLAISYLMLRRFGTNGAVMCMMLTAVIVTALYLRAYRKNVNPDSRDTFNDSDASHEAMEHIAPVTPIDAAGEARVEDEVLV